MMVPMNGRDAILEQCAERGWRASIVPVARRDDALAAIRRRHAAGEFDEALYREYLVPILEAPLPDAPTPRSILLLATPSVPVRLHFVLDGIPFPVLAAPGYLRRVSPRPRDAIPQMLALLGLRAAPLDVPLKTLATLSGFARYGRNNITYVEGLGSLCALAAFVTDLDCDEMPAQPQEALARCASCRACHAACPTGAIGDDRFLLDAERRITFWNEKDPDVAFPAWIQPEWHNALFGCMHCQRVCPENAAHIDRVLEGPVFDEPTTQRLLAGAKPDDFSDDVRRAVAAWRLTDLIDYLRRNLGVLLRNEMSRRGDRGREERERS